MQIQKEAYFYGTFTPPRDGLVPRPARVAQLRLIRPETDSLRRPGGAAAAPGRLPLAAPLKTKRSDVRAGARAALGRRSARQRPCRGGGGVLIGGGGRLRRSPHES